METTNLEEGTGNKRLRDDEYGDYEDDNLALSESDKEREFELALNNYYQSDGSHGR